MAVLTASPADVLQKFLVTQPLPIVTDPLAELAFPLFSGHMPEDKLSGIPTDAAAVYDTLGIKEGRLMKSGKNILHPGIQIKVRSDEYTKGHSKISEIGTFFEGVKNVLVIVNTLTFKILNISQVGTVISLGHDNVNRNDQFTLNFLITLQ